MNDLREGAYTISIEVDFTLKFWLLDFNKFFNFKKIGDRLFLIFKINLDEYLYSTVKRGCNLQ